MDTIRHDGLQAKFTGVMKKSSRKIIFLLKFYRLAADGIIKR